MDIEYYGEISFNKPLTEDAVKAVEKAFDTPGLKGVYEKYLVLSPEDDTLSIDEFHQSGADGIFNTMIEALAPLGYVLNGSLRYFGDYDGMLYITDNEVEELDDLDRWQNDASDEELIEVLEKRGYKVEKTDSAA